MDQEALKSSLSGLERKILVLLNEHKSLKEDLKSARQETLDLKSSLKSKDEVLSNFKNQIKITKIVDNINPEDGKCFGVKEESGRVYPRSR